MVHGIIEARWAAIYIPHFTSCYFLGKVTYFGAYVFFAIDSLKPIGKKSRQKQKQLFVGNTNLRLGWASQNEFFDRGIFCFAENF